MSGEEKKLVAWVDPQVVLRMTNREIANLKEEEVAILPVDVFEEIDWRLHKARIRPVWAGYAT